jgi:hypothetical protein
MSEFNNSATVLKTDAGVKQDHNYCANEFKLQSLQGLVQPQQQLSPEFSDSSQDMEAEKAQQLQVSPSALVQVTGSDDGTSFDYTASLPTQYKYRLKAFEGSAENYSATFYASITDLDGEFMSLALQCKPCLKANFYWNF